MELKSTEKPNRRYFNDHTGEVINGVEFLKYVGYDFRNKHVYLCRCPYCGETWNSRYDDIRSGATKSCGCIRRAKLAEMAISRETTHGMSKTHLYYEYKRMLQRCYNLNNESYPNYGGRGITVCDEWLEQDGYGNRIGFIKFKDWAYASGYNDKLTLDRIDVNGNYEPSNCRWTTMAMQSNNKTNNVYITLEQKFEDKSIKYTFTMSIWSKITGIPITTLRYRLLETKVDWSVEEALTTSPFSSKRGDIQILNIGPYIEYNRPDKIEQSIR